MIPEKRRDSSPRDHLAWYGKQEHWKSCDRLADPLKLGRSSNGHFSLGVLFMGVGQLNSCQNPDCRSKVLPEKDSTEQRSIPKCSCRSEIKKPYKKPELRILDPNTSPEVIAIMDKDPA